MLLNALHFLLIILEVLFFFNLLIVVHELGHFLAARWRGSKPGVTVVIEEFGVWFGKPIWRRKFNGVWYSFGSIPLGGFVKLPQLGNKAIEGEAETEVLPPLKPWDRIIIAFAGPLFSFLLALTLATVVWAIGRPTSQPDATTEIGIVVPGGPADKAGLKPGDKVLAIDGKPVDRFSGPVNSVMWAIISSEGDTIDFLVERQGMQQHIHSGWEKEEASKWVRQPKRRVKIAPRIIPEVARVEKGGPGEVAGLREGDIVTVANGKPIFSLDEIGTLLKAAPDAPLKLTVQRGGSTYETALTPKPLKKGEENLGPDVGVEWGRFYLEHPGPWSQVTNSVHAIGNMVRAVTSRKSDVKLQDFSGPVGIMNMYRRILSAEEGWRLAISFSVLFNVNLALINLLPLTVLDGGHITLGFIEMIRRRPGQGRFLEILDTICVVTILGYVLYVTFFDVGDFFPRKAPLEGPPPKPAAVMATPAPATPVPAAP